MIFKNKYFFDGLFGIERETLRVTQNGILSRLPHPFENDRRLERDFCENQLELITPVCSSISELMQTLTNIDSYIKAELKKHGEYLWMSSNPPHFEHECDIQIANYVNERSFKREYRIKLAKRYGKRLMLYSGIHFNFSFPDKFFEEYDEKDFRHSKNQMYFELTKKAFYYSWLLVILTASSPVRDLSMEKDTLCGSVFDGYSSYRNSDLGYWNKFIPILDYTSLETYIASINEYIEKGMLFSSAELYLPVRPKPKGTDMTVDLAKSGINHIELRMTDVNPLSPVGIFEEDLRFEHYFLLYLMSLPDIELTPQRQLEAIDNHKSAAKFDLAQAKINGIPALSAANNFLNNMCSFFSDYPDILKIINAQLKKLENGGRYCDTIYSVVHKDYQNEMIELFKKQGTWK